MVQNIRDRINRLEGAAAPVKGLAERLQTARKRLKAMTAEQRAEERAACFQAALDSPSPRGVLAKRLWSAARRMAIHFAGNGA
jgi:hypothetical protein